MENKPKILSTVSLDTDLVKKAKYSGVDIDCIDFIKIESIIDNQLQQHITDLLKQELTVVFTSANAVKAISKCLKGNKVNRVFCIGQATKFAVENYFDSSVICGWANDAEELAKVILETGTKKITFFCGKKRMDTLPNMLKYAGIEVQEIPVYQTIETNIEVTEFYDAILFFSPSSANSFFAKNTISEETVLFAIGKTTASALKQKSSNKIIVSYEPRKEMVVDDAICYFVLHV